MKGKQLWSFGKQAKRLRAPWNTMPSNRGKNQGVEKKTVSVIRKITNGKTKKQVARRSNRQADKFCK